MLEEGSVVRLRSSGAEYRVERLLGRGGQGAVYRVSDDRRSAPLALKWYRPAAASRTQHRRLERLIGLRRPSTEFLWPIEFAVDDERRSWGYVMPLGHESVIPLGRVVKGGAEIRLRTLVQGAAQVAQAFQQLHALGLCYADVSLNNVLIDVSDGRVQICDNDNVTIDGRPSDVLGTPYYIAPEVVRGEANPSISSDRHSLAVMLFTMLVRQHPLLGAREHERRLLDERGLTALLGSAPLFVFDPADEANRPVSGVHENLRLLWPALPAFLRRLFLRAFTEGLHEPAARVTEAEWLDALLRLRGLVRRCEACGTEQFFDETAPAVHCAEETCRAALARPVLLTARPRRSVVLERGGVLHRADLTGAVRREGAAIGDVVRHPVSSGLALRNRSGADWHLVRDAARPTIPDGAAVLLRDGQTIDFGRIVGRISSPH